MSSKKDLDKFLSHRDMHKSYKDVQLSWVTPEKVLDPSWPGLRSLWSMEDTVAVLKVGNDVTCQYML